MRNPSNDFLDNINTENFADEYVSANNAALSASEVATSKTERLAEAKSKKLSDFSTHNQFASLDDSYSVLEDGTLESNKNKVWADNTSVGPLSKSNLQNLLNYSVDERMLTPSKEEGGYPTFKDGTEYTGRTSWFYSFGSKDKTDGITKYGKARGDLKDPSERFIPNESTGYGWDSGPKGVDANDKKFGYLFPENITTLLEGTTHASPGALEARVVKDIFDRDIKPTYNFTPESNTIPPQTPAPTVADTTNNNLITDDSLLGNALGSIAAQRGWNAGGIDNILKFMDGVGNIESNNIADRKQGDSEDGIGRGKYQFETSKGSGANATAVNRLVRGLPKLGMDLSSIPEQDRAVLSSEDPDFSKLSEDTQDLIFLVDKAEAGGVDLTKVATGEISAKDAWLDFHWKGDAKDRASKAEMWDKRFVEQAYSPEATKESVQDSITETLGITDEEYYADLRSAMENINKIEAKAYYQEYGSGASEYYTSAEAVFGEPVEYNREEGKRIFDELIGIVDSKGRYKDIIDKESDAARRLKENRRWAAENASGLDRTLNTLQGFGATFINELLVNPLDAIGDLTGTFDLGTDEEKQEMVNSTFGYNPENVGMAMEKIAVEWDKVADSSLSLGERSTAALKGVAESLITPEMLGTSLGALLAWVSPGKVFSMFSKGSKYLDNIARIEKVKDAGKITALDARVKKLKALSSVEGSKDLLMKQSGFIVSALGNVNNQYEEFVQNNNGVELEGADKASWYAGRFAVQLFNQNLDKLTDFSIMKNPGIVAGILPALKAMTEKEFMKIVKVMGKGAVKTLENAGKEAAQEYSQTMMELYNSRAGSAKFEDVDSFVAFITDTRNTREAGIAALAGAGGSGQFELLGATTRGLTGAVGAGAAKIVKAGAEKKAKAEEAADVPDGPVVDPEVSEEEVSAAVLEADTAANDTIKKYIDLASDEDLSALILSGDVKTEEELDTTSISEGVEALEGTYSDIIQEIEQAESVISSRQNTDRSKESDDINLKVLRKAKLEASRKVLESDNASALGSGYSPEDIVDDFIQAKVEVEGDLDVFTEEDKALVNKFLEKNGQKPFRFKNVRERLEGKDASVVYQESMGEGANSAISRRARLRSLVNTPKVNKTLVEKEIKGINNFLNTQKEKKIQYEATKKELQKTINNYNKNRSKPGASAAVPKSKDIPGTDGKNFIQVTKNADGTYKINESSTALLDTIDDTIDHLTTTLTRYKTATIKAVGKVPSTYSGLAVPAAAGGDKKIADLRKSDEVFYQKNSPTKVFADTTSVKKWQKGGDYLALNETKIATGSTEYNADDVILLTTLDIKKGSAISNGLAKAVKAGATVILDPSLNTPSGKEAKKEGANGRHSKRINALADRYGFGNVKVNGKQVWLPTKEAEKARTKNALDSKAKEKKDRLHASLVRVFDVRTTAKEEKRTLTQKEVEAENKVLERAKEYFTGKDAAKNIKTFVANQLRDETKALEEELRKIMLKEGTSSKDYSEALNKAKYATATRIADKNVKAEEARLAKGGTLVKEWKEAQEADRKGQATLSGWVKKTFGDSAKKIGIAMLKDSKGSNVKVKKTFYSYQVKLPNGKTQTKTSTNFKSVEDLAIDGVYTVIEADPSKYIEVSETTVLNTLSVEDLKLEGEENALFNGFVGSAIESLEAAIAKKKQETILDFSDVDSPAASLIYNKEGKLNANVAVAARAALYNFIKNNGYLLTKGNKTLADIADILGKHESELSIEAITEMQDKGLLMKTAADSLGKDIASLLGIRAKSDDTVDAQNYSALITELGQLSLLMGMTKKEGLLSKSEMPSTKFALKVLGKKPSEVSESAAAVNFVDAKDTDKMEAAIFEIEIINEILPGMDARRKEPSFKPLTQKEKDKASGKVKNDKLGVNAPSESRKAMEKQMDTENVVNLPLLRFMINDKNKLRVMKLLGYIDLESEEGKAKFDKLSYKEQQVQESKNRAILRNFENLTWVNSTADETQDSISVWFKYFFSKNGRFFVDSNILNPQTNKHLDRFLTQPKDHNNTYSYKKGEFYANGDKKPVTGLVHYALAQAFGYATDKKAVKDIEAFAKGILSDVRKPRSKAGRLARIEELREEFLNTGKVKSLGIEIEHLGHALQGFEFLEKMVTDPLKFDSAITAEFDAVTSGFALKLLQMPILGKELYKWLAKVGIFKTGAKAIEELGGESITMNNVLSKKGFLDSYQSLAADIKAISYEKLRSNAAASTAEFNLLGKESKYTENLWKAVSNMLPSAEDGISPELRSLFKYPFMTFNYASSIKSIRGRLKLTMQDDIAKKIAAIDMDNITDKEQPIVDMLKAYVSSDEIKTLKALQDQVRKKDLAFVRVGKGGSLGNYLDIMIDSSYGVQVQKVLETQFAPFVETQDSVNNSFKAMFEVFKISFEQELKEARKKGPVSSKKEKLIYESLKQKWPAIRGPLSNMEREFDGEGTVGVYSTETASPNGIYSGRKAAITTLSAELKKELGTATIQTSHMIKALSAAISAGSVVPIHYIDGAVMADTILNVDGGVTSIHDAIMVSLVRMAEGQKAYNKSAITTSARYSYIDEIVKSLDRVIANTELFGEEKTEYQKAKITLADKTETNAASFLIDTRNSMATIANTTNNERNKLFKELNKGSYVMHMAGTPEGVATFEQDNAVEYQQIDRYAQIEDNTKALKELHTLAENHCQ